MVPKGCGQPSAPASVVAPEVARHQLVATWVRCRGPSIFGPHSGGALEILANGTWRQLGKTPGGAWEPLQGANDSGTWQLLPASNAVGTVSVGVVRFVAGPLASTTAAAPHEWTVRVEVTNGPHVRAQFVEGTVVANYRLLVPPTSAGS